MKTTCAIKTVDHLLERSSAADLKKRKLGDLWADNLLTKAILENFDHMTKMMTSRVPRDYFLQKYFWTNFRESHKASVIHYKLETQHGVVLVSLLLTLNIFHTLF